MIFILLAAIYISFLSWGWGFILFKILQGTSKQQQIFEENFIVTCFSGLALLGVVFSMVSLFFPVGGLIAQMFVLLPVTITCSMHAKKCVEIGKLTLQKARELTPWILILLAACIALVLLIGSFTITHPDTLMYHAQCIRWLQDYKTIPGLANLGYHYGLQSSWFILSALFSFKFISQSQVPFLNCTAVLWLIIFVAGKCNESLSGRIHVKTAAGKGLLWLVLLVTCFWSYTQVRLTATSASPDFISAMYTWLVFYLVVDDTSMKNEARVLLVIFLSLFAITVKLSALPVIFAALYFYYRNQTGRIMTATGRLVACGVIVIIPCMVRNVITTGYPLFPSPLGDFMKADWKMPKAILLDRIDYIKTYARVEDSTSLNANADMDFSTWIPLWWQNQSLADQFILSGLAVLITIALVAGAKRKTAAFNTYLWPLIFSLSGVVFWFTQAPDPRFGFGFITSSAGLLLLVLHSAYTNRVALPQYWLKSGLLLFTVVIISYSTYRVIKFFARQNLLKPSGVVSLPFKTIRCQGIQVNIPVSDDGCGGTTPPCVYQSCNEFVLRGTSLGEGFKPKNPAVK